MAAHELDATLDLPISDPETVFQAARQAHDARDWPIAAILWTKLRVLTPDDPLAYSDGAIALREAGDLAGAEGVA